MVAPKKYLLDFNPTVRTIPVKTPFKSPPIKGMPVVIVRMLPKPTAITKAITPKVTNVKIDFRVIISDSLRLLNLKK